MESVGVSAVVLDQERNRFSYIWTADGGWTGYREGTDFPTLKSALEGAPLTCWGTKEGTWESWISAAVWTDRESDVRRRYRVDKRPGKYPTIRKPPSGFPRPEIPSSPFSICGGGGRPWDGGVFAQDLRCAA